MKHKYSAVRRQYEKQNFDLFKPYLPWAYASNWWENIRWFFRSFKLAAQRIKRGYSDYDIVDLDSYLTGLIACALDDFANRTCSIPQEYLDKFNNDEDKAFECWKNQLKSVSYTLFQSLECLEEFNYNVPEMPGKIVFEDGVMKHEDTTEEEIEKWRKNVESISKTRHECFRLAFKWLRKHWWNLWI